MSTIEARELNEGFLSTTQTGCSTFVHATLIKKYTYTWFRHLKTYFRVGFVAFATAVGGFWLLLSNPCHHFINSGQIINHGKEPSPEIQMTPVG
jgi:hypothetical protein